MTFVNTKFDMAAAMPSLCEGAKPAARAGISWRMATAFFCGRAAPGKARGGMPEPVSASASGRKRFGDFLMRLLVARTPRPKSQEWPLSSLTAHRAPATVKALRKHKNFESHAVKIEPRPRVLRHFGFVDAGRS